MAAAAENSGLILETKVGTLKGIPTSLLGWVCVASIAGFLLWQMTVGMSGKLDRLIDLHARQTTLLERILDKLPVSK